MVRKIASIIMLASCLLIASPLLASAQTVYSEGNISSTYKDIFKDILNDVTILDDYVLFRSGQYEYSMYVGEINFEGGVFSSTDCTEYIISTFQNGYSGGIYNLSTNNSATLYLNPQNYLVYSNLGYYPKLIERGVMYEFAILTAIIICGLCVLVRPIFKFSYRLRR